MLVSEYLQFDRSSLIIVYVCKCVEVKRRAAKQSIKDAMSSQDIDKLNGAIADGSAVLNDNELAHAKKLLDFLRVSQGSTHRPAVAYTLC